MIKIIAGKYKSRKLNYFKMSNVRPTQARVRKSIMDSLQTFENKKVLDLFSGIGTLGIESLSRGASYVEFVDNNSKVLDILKKNIESLSIENKCRIFKNDSLKHIIYTDKKFDIIFADPPYGKFDFDILLPEIKKKITPNGVFCYESQKTKINLEINMTIKNYGNTQVIFWRNEEWKKLYIQVLLIL